MKRNLMNHPAVSDRNKIKKSYRRTNSSSRSRADEIQQHQRHQEGKQYSVYHADSRAQKDISSSSESENYNVDQYHFPKAASILKRQIEKTKLSFNDNKMESSVSREERERRGGEMDDQRFEKYAERNVCNNSNGGGMDNTCWEEMRKALGNEDANIAVPSAAYIEQDVIGKQRQEIMLLMEELGTRDQELNDLVRSHQSQVKAWENDRNKLKELQQRLSTYEKELKRSDQQLKTTLEEMQRVTNQKEIDGMELKRTKGEMEGLSKKIQENSYYLKEMEVQNKTLLESVKKLLSAKEDLELKGKDLSSRLKSKTGELNMHQSEISKLVSQNKGLESHLQEANETMRNLKTETAAWKNRYCHSRDESDRLTEENKKREEQIQTLTVQLHETLQQTLALQKALFTSCEREKCKEEVMNSLRKQQKRTMQEMSSLRKLYERQSNDMTLYHLSVMNDPSDGPGQGVNTSREAGGMMMMGSHGAEADKDISQSESHDQFQEWQDKLERVQMRRGHGHGEGKHMYVTSRSNKNMSYNTKKKPNFLNFETRADSQTFLCKKKLSNPVDPQSLSSPSPTDRNCNERYEFDNSDVNNDEEEEDESTVISRHSKSKEILYDIKKMANESKSLDRRGRNKEKEEADQRKKRSLSSNDVENCHPSKHPPKTSMHSYSRPQSPTTLKERGTSPINSILMNDDSWSSGDVTKFLKIVDKCSNTYENICRSGKLDLPTVPARKEEKTLPIDHTTLMVSPTKKGHGHNETSGVYLSSSDCSCSTISSPGRGKVYDELTPADSDGMCQELKREFLPAQQDSLCSFHKKVNKKTPGSIHLYNTPQPVPHSKKDLQSSRGGNVSNSEVNDKGYSANHDLYACQTYCLVEDPKDRKMVMDERGRFLNFDRAGWSDESRSERSNFSPEAPKQQETRDQTPNHLSFMRKENNIMMKNLRRNQKIDPYAIINGSYDKNENQVVNKVDSELSSHGPSSPVFHREPSGFTSHKYNHEATQPSTSQQTRGGDVVKSVNRERTFTRDPVGCNISRSNNNSREERKKSSNSENKNVRIAFPERDERLEETSSSNNLKKGPNNHSSQSDILTTLGSETSICDSIQSTNTQVVNNPKTSSHYLQRFMVDSPKSCQQNNQSQKISLEKGRSEKRDYFYEENLTSDSEHPNSVRNGVNGKSGNKGKMESNAYIVPVSSNSRAFTSTKAPSLYKQLSNIHFSEKSKRYEWANTENGGNNPNHAFDSTNQGEESNYNSNSNMNTNNSDKDNDNSNNSNVIEFATEQKNGENHTHLLNANSFIIDDIVPDQSIDSLIISSNMDKFHHHYNNIVKKLNYTNDSSLEQETEISFTEISFTEISFTEIIKDEVLLQNEVEKDEPDLQDSNLIKKIESRNFQLDETCLSQSEIELSLLEDKKVNDIVKKLNFSESTIVEPSDTDTKVIESCKSSNYVTERCNDQTERVGCDKDPSVCSIDEGVGSQSSCDDVKRNRVFHESSCKVRLPNTNICSHQDELKYDKLSVFKQTSNNTVKQDNSISFFDKGSCKEKLEVVTSLPDYFPDISCVTIDLEDGSCENSLKQLQEMEEDCEDSRTEISSSIPKPYSRTSTPTPKEDEDTSELSTQHSTNNEQSLISSVHALNEKDSNKFFEKNCENNWISNSNDNMELRVDNTSIVCNMLESHNKQKESSLSIGSSHYVDSGIFHEVMNSRGDMKVDMEVINEKVIKTISDIPKLFQTDVIHPYQVHIDVENEKTEKGEDNTIDSHHLNNQCQKLEFDTAKEKIEQYSPLDQFEKRLSSYLMDSSEDETSEDSSKVDLSLSPSSKLHRLLVESQKMVSSMGKVSSH